MGDMQNGSVAHATVHEAQGLMDTLMSGLPALSGQQQQVQQQASMQQPSVLQMLRASSLSTAAGFREGQAPIPPQMSQASTVEGAVASPMETVA